jgi:hypothetical protein
MTTPATLLFAALNVSGALLAMMTPSLVQEVGMAVAAAVTLGGAWLCWTAPRHRMSVEERSKDGHITEDEARRRVLFRAKLGPTLVIVGVLGLGWAVLA